MRKLEGLYDQHGEKLRYVAVGVWNTVFSYVLFVALIYMLQPVLQPLESSDVPMLQWTGSRYYLVVQWVAWFVSVPQSTLAFKFLVFRSRGHWAHEVGRSYAVALPTQLLSSGLLWFFSAVIGLRPLLGQLITVVVAAVLSYLGHKNYTFRTTRS